MALPMAASRASFHEPSYAVTSGSKIAGIFLEPLIFWYAGGRAAAPLDKYVARCRRTAAAHSRSSDVARPRVATRNAKKRISVELGTSSFGSYHVTRAA
eukprot:1641214-Prymnesium_polylepis.1